MNSYITDISVLLEKKNRDNALEFLRTAAKKGLIPKESAEKVLHSYKKFKYIQVIPSLVLISVIFIGLFMCEKYTETNQRYVAAGFVLMLVGVFGGIFIWPIATCIAGRKTLWHKYYSWYKHANSLADLEKILDISPIIIPEDIDENITEEQLIAKERATEKYREAKDLPSESEEESNRRIREQMVENGYTEEQIRKTMGGD